MREIKAGIFNAETARKKDGELEGNLSTIMRSVRQYWHKTAGELNALVRDFMTLSCAEYSSPDILKLLGDYDPGSKVKCAMKTVSEHAMFQIAFGEVVCRGAPHYHVMLWIKGAPGSTPITWFSPAYRRESRVTSQTKKLTRNCTPWS